MIALRVSTAWCLMGYDMMGYITPCGLEEPYYTLASKYGGRFAMIIITTQIQSNGKMCDIPVEMPHIEFRDEESAAMFKLECP